MNRPFRQTIAMILLLLLAVQVTPALAAQITTASLTGLVTDPAGAAASGAVVKAKNTATNAEQTTETGDSGYYTFASLPVGVYTITVEMQGFKKAARENVTLETGQKARLDFALEVGAVAETVLVEAGAPLLSKEDPSPSAVVENRLVRDLPLSIRNWDDLLLLVAGVQGDRYTEEGGGTASGRTGGVNVHGVRSLHNNFILDGVDNNSISTNVQELTTQVSRPSVDAIQEFKVITDPYSAEYGRSPGASISVTTRSGGNEFHGGLFEFHRNRVFDANNFFLNRVGRPKPTQIQNQFGGQVGGPVLKDRLFFFFNYEGTRIRKGVTRLTSVPLANERLGDFSAAAAAAARAAYAPIKDPLTGQPFPGNRIPADRIDPVARRIIELIPASNVTPASGPLNANNFVRAPNITDDADNYLGRGDWQINPRNNLYARYAYTDRFRFIPGFLGGIIDGTSTSAWGRLTMKAHSAAIGLNTTLTNTMVNEFRVGWGRNVSRGVQDPFGENTLSEIGIKGIPDDPLYNGGLPAIRISSGGGVTAPAQGAHLGSPVFLPKWQYTNQFQFADTLSYTAGRHNVKFGGDLRAPMRNIYLDIPAMRGDVSFTGQFTGNPIADFLLGYVGQAQTSVFTQVDQRLWMLSFFAQDDWKVTPRLTLNLGLRYDFATWPYEGANRMANLDPATGQLIFAGDGSLADRTLIKTDKNNFAPRLGVAYQLNDKTVLRTGYGRFYQLFERAGSEDQLALNPPFLLNVAVSTASRTAPIFILEDGFPASFRDPASLDLSRIRLRAVNPDSVMPSVDHWNLGIQRLLPGDVLATADYVGTKGTHLSVLRNLNQVDFETRQRPFSNLGVIEFRDSAVNSSYHGLELTVEKRFGQGLSLRSAYTFSKSIDQAQEHLFGGGSNSFLQNSRDLRQQRGLSDFDYRHRFVLSHVYELPFGPGRPYLEKGIGARLLGGWRMSGIFTRRSGRPSTVFAGSNNAFVGAFANALPDRILDGSLDPRERDVDRWFEGRAFVVPNPARPGNSGRNILIGPPLTNFDFALARSFTITEDSRVEFRWEVFNLTNTPQFGLLARDASSPGTIGRITTLAGDPRVMQFALKLYF